MGNVFNMVGGGGGMSESNAVLLVTVPTGSSVTASKGGTTLTAKLWTQTADNTLDTAIISVPARLFDSNPWTVNATKVGFSMSGSVVIDSAKEYDMMLDHLYLYNRGKISSAIGSLVVGRNSGVTPTRTEYDDYYYMRGVGSAQSGSVGTTVGSMAVDLTNYTSLNAIFSAFERTGDGSAQIGATSVRTNAFSPVWNGAPTPNEIVTLDISALSGNYYVGFGGGGSINRRWEYSIVELWLD